ncbi:unnamed protein product [Rotaria sordida]|uniref:Uncharacterized protein n=1 Tax=Rotaria sordida TaxID=392033 RepID=A0A819IFV4_9BILA|nr:unnamed protein product [Rotaria sordida]
MVEATASSTDVTQAKSPAISFINSNKGKLLLNLLQEDDNETTPDFTDEDYESDLSDDDKCFDILLNTLNSCLVLCPNLIVERQREHESLNNIIIIDNLTKVDQGNLLSWLTEPDAVDQFAVQSDDSKTKKQRSMLIL